MMWILKTCPECNQAGYALRAGSDAEKLTAHIICLYCYNNLEPQERDQLLEDDMVFPLEEVHPMEDK